MFSSLKEPEYVQQHQEHQEVIAASGLQISNLGSEKEVH